MTSKKTNRNTSKNENSKSAPEQEQIDNAETSQPVDAKKVDTEKAAPQSTPTDKTEKQPQAASQPEPVKQQATEPAQKQSNTLGAVAIALVVALSGGLYFQGYQQTQQYNLQLANQNAQITNLEQKVNLLQNSTASEIKSSRQETLSQVDQISQKTQVLLEQQDKSIESLQLALAELKGRRPNDWLLAESDYFVKMAGRKLWLEHDVVSATKLMETADQRIAALNDPSLVPLRKAMADDIIKLRAVPLIDRDGLVLRLTSLQEKIASLPLSHAILPEAEIEAEAVVSSDINQWQENLMTSLKDFSGNFITYRKRDGNVTPLLTPKQHFYLQENLKAKIETAIKAVYREQGDVYVSSLEAAKEWSTQFFNQEDKKVQSFINSLDSLATQTIEVEYPVKLNTQPIIADVISERLRREVTSIITEEDKA
ncbi:uroporphyrinogen-III C-methyltransferase [Vibrio sp. Of7-15]|uniref:uroporphyrinogen-III C-methyltransferase n=1 Tax=Vibrio sp. Of7-15 TaxID=2724879 RepID=UPI001EF37C55|nr:uroporphyrinogen-III C-methyltransferase [Vibrio sp. Of7-15]MCG7496727.1 uroporphyrinogen-III C-methyltransferase [Vibrio sp. Of7-15]